jgi:hypothetical protein
LAGTGRRALVTAGIGVLAAIAWADLVLGTVLPTLAAPHWRTPSYWVVAQLARDERLRFAYDNARFRAESIALGTVGDVWLPNPPISILPTLPLGVLSEAQARDAVVVLGLVALLAAVMVLARSLGLPLAGTFALGALAGWLQPVRHNVAWGQVFTILLLLGAAGGGLAPGRSAAHVRLAGVALGLAAILKLPYGIVLVLPALARARWRVVAAAAAVVAVAVTVSLVVWGPQPWLAWAGALPAWRARPEASVPALQTIYSLLVHLFRGDVRWNPEPLADLPWVADALWVVAGAALVGATWIAIRRGSPAADRDPALRLLPIGLAVLLGPLLIPGVEDHHYLLAIVPLAATGKLVADDLAVSRRASAVAATPRRAAPLAAAGVLGVVVALLGVDWGFNAAPAPGLAAVLQYPRVGGALALWALGLWWLWRAGSRISRPEPSDGFP